MGTAPLSATRFVAMSNSRLKRVLITSQPQSTFSPGKCNLGQALFLFSQH